MSGVSSTVRVRPSHPPSNAVMNPNSTPPQMSDDSLDMMFAVACAIGTAFACIGQSPGPRPALRVIPDPEAREP
jgi:hypothetical protein